jgi:hypothetical protein
VQAGKREKGTVYLAPVLKLKVLHTESRTVPSF